MSTALNLGATAVVAAAILGRWSADAAPHGRSFCDPDSAWTSEFADEFDGSALNDEVWTVTVGKKATEAPLTHSAGESYFGADCLGDDCILLGSCRSAACTAENVYLDNGTLVLRSQRQAVEGANYTTGAVTTRDKTTWTAAPGAFRMCISAKLPGSGESGQGIWPAHWLMPNDDSCDPDEGEIDIMEMVDGTGTVYGTYHWQTSFPEYNCSFPQNHSSISGNVDLSGQEWGSTFHEYAVEHSPDYVAFVVDGKVLTNRSRESDDLKIWPVPWYLILNTAIGGGWPGEPDDNSTFPTYHVIDYVRVSRRNNDTSAEHGSTHRNAWK